MNATISIALGVIGLGGLFLLISEILNIINRGNIAEKNAQVIDLTKKIQDQKIVIQGQEKTAKELLDEYRKQAEEFRKFDVDNDPTKPAS